MTDFGRVPLMEVEQPAKEEKEIFDKPKTEPPTNSAEDEKKLKLKEHLKKCREKSAEVRKAKAQEKKKNKRPVGRPKKVKEPKQNINMEVSLDNNQNDIMEKEQPLDHIQEQAEDKTEVEIFKPELKTIPEDKVLEPPPPQAQPVFDQKNGYTVFKYTYFWWKFWAYTNSNCCI